MWSSVQSDANCAHSRQAVRHHWEHLATGLSPQLLTALSLWVKSSSDSGAEGYRFESCRSCAVQYKGPAARSRPRCCRCPASRLPCRRTARVGATPASESSERFTDRAPRNLSIPRAFSLSIGTNNSCKLRRPVSDAAGRGLPLPRAGRAYLARARDCSRPAVPTSTTCLRRPSARRRRWASS